MKTKFRILSAIMSVAIILSSLVIVLPVSAATTDADLWSAHAATSFASDDPATTGVIEIGTAAELAYLATLVNAGSSNDAGKAYNSLSYKLIADIDATAHQWVAIGTGTGAATQFKGTFDGDNFTVSTALTDATNTFYTTSALHGGLFGRIGAGTVKNLKLNFTWVYNQRPKTSNNWFGGLSCAIYDASTIDNVHITLNVTGTTNGISNNMPTGGMTGYLNANGATISNCSVGGTVAVSTSDSSTAYSQLMFASFFGAGSGGSGSKTTIKNCVATTDVTLSGSGHQDIAGTLFARLWDSVGNHTINVQNFVDATSVTTKILRGSFYLHFGSLVGKTTQTSKTTATTQAFKVNGMVAMPTLNLYTAGNNTTTSSVANLIASSSLTSHASNFTTLQNVYTTNPHLPDIWMNTVGPINVDVNANGTLDEGDALTTTGAHDGYTEAATFDYKVAGDKTTVIIPKGLYETFAAIGTVTVGHGSKKVVASTDTYTVNANGDYEFVLASTVGTAYMSVAQANGETVTLYDRWTSASTAITVPSGKGTEAAPYTITTPEELGYLGWIWNNWIGTTAPKTIYYELGNNIDLNHREWTPVGAYNCAYLTNKDFRFKGGIDGNGYTISNLLISDGAHPDDQPAAMFGATANPTKLHDFNLTGNITVTDSTAANNDSIGMISAFASGATSINNVHVDADVKVTITAGPSWVGGIVGAGNNVSITNSTMSGSVKVIAASGKNVMPCAGGIIGIDTGYEELENCINYADVTVQANTSNSFAGGLIGATRGNNSTNSAGEVSDNTYTVNKCVNYGTISVVKGLSGSANNQRVGGIIGQTGRDGLNQPIIVTNCVNLGEVLLGSQVGLGTSSGVSQIVGFNEITGTTSLKDGHQQGLTINNCYSIQADTLYAHYVYSPKLYTTSDPDKEIYLNGVAVEKDGSQEIPNGSMYFEIDTVVSGETATVTVYSKTALDVFLAAGFTMELVYGDNTVTDLSNAAANGDTYVWTFTADGENKATLTVTKTVGNATVGTKSVSTSARAASWAGMYAADSFANDDDTTDVIEIATAGELGLIARKMNMGITSASVLNANFQLIDDINLAGAQWHPISQTHNAGRAFQGSIDGNNKTISNLTLTDDHYIYSQSFIGRTAGDFTVQNLTFADPVLVTAGEPVNTNLPAVTVLAGANYADNGLISNVDVVGMDMTIAYGMSYYGGLVGYLAGANAVVENCEVSGTITGTYDNAIDVKVGGIVARGRLGSVENCVSDVAINVLFTNSTGYSYVGGIVGEVYSNSDAETVTVTNCVSKGDIYVNADTEKTEGDISIGIGGILGTMWNQGSVVISNCVSASEFAGTNNDTIIKLDIGGIVGHNFNHTHGTGDAATHSSTTLSNNYALTTETLVGRNTTDHLTSENDTAWDVGVTTNGTASIRVDYSEANTTGIRFTSFIESALIESMKADSNVAVEFGTIIAPTFIINDYGMDVFRTVGVKIEYEVDKYAADGNGVDGWAKVEGDNSYFTGALIGITDYTEEYTAVAYVTVTIDGVDYTFYADYNNEVDRARSISFVANAALTDRSDDNTDGEYFNEVNDEYTSEYGQYSCYSDKQLEVIRNYIAD